MMTAESQSESGGDSRLQDIGRESPLPRGCQGEYAAVTITLPREGNNAPPQFTVAGKAEVGAIFSTGTDEIDLSMVFEGVDRKGGRTQISGN